MSEIRISKIWEELSKEQISDSATPFLRRDFKKSDGDDPIFFTIARSFPENDYGILLETNKKFFPNNLEIPIFENFEIKIITDILNKKYIWFHLKKTSEFQKQFELICSDIIINSLIENNQLKIILSFINNIRIWQELLKEKKSELSDGGLKGLFAELYFLSEILFPKFGVNKSLNYWKPNNETHDFILENLTVEIKSTSTSPPKSAKINSLKQLDETMTKNLYLYLIQLGENKGESVPEIIDKIKKIIKEKNPEDLYLFERKIFSEKYNDEFREKYLKRKFFKNNEYIYLIEKDFPRIREKDLVTLKRAGILKISYEISLAACENYKIKSENFYRLLK